MSEQEEKMAWDDPIVWILIVAVVVFLFGSSKIPGIAKALGQARREFDTAMKGATQSPKVISSNAGTTPTQDNVAVSAEGDDPLFRAAKREGIDVAGKTREEIASELSWKLNKK